MSKLKKYKYEDLTDQDKIDIYTQLKRRNLAVVEEFYVRFGKKERTLYSWKKNIREEIEAGKLILTGWDNSKNAACNDYEVNGVSAEVRELMKPKATSTLYGPDGEVKLEWVKSDIQKDNALETYEKALNVLSESLIESRKPIKVPKVSNSDSMTVYTIGDAHVGMLAHKAETGNDNDLKTVEDDLVIAMTMLTEQSVATEEAFIIDVGDYFHSDNQSNTTAASGNRLDVDGRYHKVLEVGLRMTTELVDMALTKHKVVRWRSAIGNHNEHTALMINAFLKAYYRNESRVIVHDTPNMLMYHQFGKNLIGITHGHTVKADKLGEIMSVDCEELWSSTKNRYWYTGHVHHLSTKEYPSCVVETFRTLSGKDAWHSASGYRSGQDMKAITLHKDFGEVGRNTVNIAAIQNRQN
jgi:hypothetical protein